MRTRPTRRSRVLWVLATSLLGMTLLAGGTAALAETPAPADKLLQYEGPLDLSSVDGNGVYTVHLTVDCSGEPCTALLTIVTGEVLASPSNDLALPLVNGSLSVALPAYGNLCVPHWIGAGQLTITVTSASATINRGSGSGGPIACPDGSEASASAATVAGTLAYQSGSTCLIDSSCPTPKPIPNASAASERKPIAPALSVPAEPSTLSALPLAADAITPAAIAWSAGGAIVLVLIVGFPSVLLDSASERVIRWAEERRIRRGRIQRNPLGPPPLTVIGWPLAIVGLVVAALASAFVDPTFGFTPEGARVAMSIVTAFILAIALSWVFEAIVMRRSRPDSQPRIEFRPVTLLVVAAAVLVSRLTGFQPGFIFGLVAGVGFGALIATAERARAALLGIGYLIVISIGGWLGYSAFVGAIGHHPTGLQRFALEVLSAVAITGLTALPIALLPLRGLTGHLIWQWSRWAWAVLYAISTAAFLLVLLPLPDSWRHVDAQLWVWAIGYATYAAASVLIWLVVVRPWSRGEQLSD